MTRKLSRHRATHSPRVSGPLQIIDPTTHVAYVLVRADVYEQMLGGMEELDPRSTYPFIEKVMQEDDARDPLLARYQQVASDKPAR
jgi:hypothetical protein